MVDEAPVDAQDMSQRSVDSESVPDSGSSHGSTVETVIQVNKEQESDFAPPQPISPSHSSQSMDSTTQGDSYSSSDSSSDSDSESEKEPETVGASAVAEENAVNHNSEKTEEDQEEGEDEDEDPDIDPASFMTQDQSLSRDVPLTQNTESALKVLHAHLKDYATLKEHKPMMFIFLHFLVTSHPYHVCFAFFDWLSDDCQAKCRKNPKLLKKFVVSIVSTFLAPEAPMSLNLMKVLADSHQVKLVSGDALCKSVLESLQGQTGQPGPATQLWELFKTQISDEKDKKVLDLLNEVCISLEPMFNSLVELLLKKVNEAHKNGLLHSLINGVDQLKEKMNIEQQNAFFKKAHQQVEAMVETLAKGHLGGTIESAAVSSIMVYTFNLSTTNMMKVSKSMENITSTPKSPANSNCIDDSPLFNTKPAKQDKKMFSGFRGVKSGSHTLSLCSLEFLQKCNICRKMIAGPCPQALRCTTSDCLVVHRECRDKASDLPCSKKQIGPSIFRKASKAPADNGTNVKANNFRWSAILNPPGLSHGLSTSPSLQAIVDSDSKNSSPSPASSAPSLHHASSLSTSSLHDTVETDEETIQSRGQSNLRKSQSFKEGNRSGGVKKPPSRSDGSTAESQQAAEDARNNLMVSRGSIDSTRDSIGAVYDDLPDTTVQDALRLNPFIGNCPADFQIYIQERKIEDVLKKFKTDKEFDRFKDWQLAVHEIIFNAKSHLRSLHLLKMLFVDPWPESQSEIKRQLGLHFVDEVIALWVKFLEVLQPTETEFLESGRITCMGTCLDKWYSDAENIVLLKRLGLSFGLSADTRTKSKHMGKDEVFLELERLRKENPELRRFLASSESQPLMNKRKFRDIYCIQTQQIMRVPFVLEPVLKKARKYKAPDMPAECERLERCLKQAKSVSDFSNVYGMRLKEISRQVAASRTFNAFWKKMGDQFEHIYKEKITHLHTCEFFLSNEITMENTDQRYRIFIFKEFLLFLPENEDAKGAPKYSLLPDIAPSRVAQQTNTTTDNRSSQENLSNSRVDLQSASAKEERSPALIPMEDIFHITDSTIRRTRGSDSKIVTFLTQEKNKNRLIKFELVKSRHPMHAEDEEKRRPEDYVNVVRKLIPERRHDRSSVSVDRSSSVSMPNLVPKTDHKRSHSHVGVTSTPRFRPNQVLEETDSLEEELDDTDTGPQTPAADTQENSTPHSTYFEELPSSSSAPDLLEMASEDQPQNTERVQELSQVFDQVSSVLTDLTGCLHRSVALDSADRDYVVDMAFANESPSVEDRAVMAVHLYSRITDQLRDLLLCTVSSTDSRSACVQLSEAALQLHNKLAVPVVSKPEHVQEEDAAPLESTDPELSCEEPRQTPPREDQLLEPPCRHVISLDPQSFSQA